MREMGPRGEQVLIQPFPSTPRGAKLHMPRNTPSIIIPEVAEEPSRTGTILAVGPGKWIPGEWWKGLYKTERQIEGRPIWDIGWHWIPGHYERMEVKPGDTVLFPRYAGVEFVRGEDAPEFVGLRLMKESDIILKIERN